jgi:uncharacterized protein YoxC
MRELKGEVTELKGLATRTAEMVSQHNTVLKVIQETMLTNDDFTKAIKALGATIDTVAEGMNTIKHENVAIGLQQNRHEERIVRLEQKTAVVGSV